MLSTCTNIPAVSHTNTNVKTYYFTKHLMDSFCFYFLCFLKVELEFCHQFLTNSLLINHSYRLLWKFQEDNNNPWCWIIKISAKVMTWHPKAQEGVRGDKKFLFVSVYSFMNSRETRTSAPWDLSSFVPFHEWINRSREIPFLCLHKCRWGLVLVMVQAPALLCLTAVRRHICYSAPGGSRAPRGTDRLQQRRLSSHRRSCNPITASHTENFFRSMKHRLEESGC